jgi:hypothetical protein
MPPRDHASGDRYEPLPGLLGLPAFVWRRLPHAGRVAVVALGAALVVGTAVAVPFIVSGKHESAEKERRADAAAKAAAERRLRADQAPHRGRAAGSPTDPAAQRQAAIVATLEESITRDARARLRAGRIPGPPVKRTVCSVDRTQLADLQAVARQAGGAVLRCLAATTIGSRPDGRRFAVGFEFVAAANWRRGTFTWCKTNPPPGEKFGGVRRAEVPLSRACVNPAL